MTKKEEKKSEWKLYKKTELEEIKEYIVNLNACILDWEEIDHNKLMFDSSERYRDYVVEQITQTSRPDRYNQTY